MNEKLEQIIRAAVQYGRRGDSEEYAIALISQNYPEKPGACSLCGQTEPELRQVPITKQLVAALWHVYRWCERERRHEFRRRDVTEEIKRSYGEVATGNFGYLVHFGGILYRPDGKKRGYWGMNMERARAFFRGEYRVPERIVIRAGQVVERGRDIAVSEVPSVSEFFDANDDYKGWQVAPHPEPEAPPPPYRFPYADA